MKLIGHKTFAEVIWYNGNRGSLLSLYASGWFRGDVFLARLFTVDPLVAISRGLLLCPLWGQLRWRFEIDLAKDNRGVKQTGHNCPFTAIKQKRPNLNNYRFVFFHHDNNRRQATKWLWIKLNSWNTKFFAPTHPPNIALDDYSDLKNLLFLLHTKFIPNFECLEKKWGK